jgi:hypothetical protein
MEQDGAEVDQGRHLLRDPFGHLADDHTAKTVPDQHNGTGCGVKDSDDLVDIGLQRELTDGSKVTGPAGQIDRRGLRAGLAQMALDIFPAPSSMPGAVDQNEHAMRVPMEEGAVDDPSCNKAKVPFASLLDAECRHPGAFEFRLTAARGSTPLAVSPDAFAPEKRTIVVSPGQGVAELVVPLSDVVRQAVRSAKGSLPWLRADPGIHSAARGRHSASGRGRGRGRLHRMRRRPDQREVMSRHWMTFDSCQNGPPPFSLGFASST